MRTTPILMNPGIKPNTNIENEALKNKNTDKTSFLDDLKGSKKFEQKLAHLKN
jgi:hypothetical protein